MKRYTNCEVYKKVEKDPEEYDFFPATEEDVYQLSGYMDVEISCDEEYNPGDKMVIDSKTYIII